MTEETETVESIADVLTAAMAESEVDDPQTETEEAPDSISKEAVTETEEVESVKEDTETVEEDNVESEEPEKVFSAPEHWSSDESEKFDTLPPEAQELLLSKEKQFQTGYQEKAQAITAIQEAIKPWLPSLAQRGVTPEQAIRTLFAAQHSLDTDGLQGILQLVKSYGIEDQVRKHFAPQTDEEDFTDPGIKALQKDISDLKGQITKTNRGIEQQTVDAGQAQIDAFRNAKTDDGVPKYPYFEQLTGLVTSYVQSGDTLESAYEKAVWTVPEFRESQNKKVVEKTDEEKAVKVKRAKRAARGVKTNGKSDPEEGAESLTLREDLSEAFRQHSS